MENKSLVLDFLEWIAEAPRTYADAMDAWRTSCPRLTIWEDAIDANLIVRTRDFTNGSMVALSSHGAAFLGAERQAYANRVTAT